MVVEVYIVYSDRGCCGGDRKVVVIEVVILFGTYYYCGELQVGREEGKKWCYCEVDEIEED